MKPEGRRSQDAQNPLGKVGDPQVEAGKLWGGGGAVLSWLRGR